MQAEKDGARGWRALQPDGVTMQDKEAIEMMQRCVIEMRQLRERLGFLSVQGEAYTVIRDLVRLASPRGGIESMGQDLVWTLQKRIEELEKKNKPLVPDPEALRED
jgi:hypothetical protein